MRRCPCSSRLRRRALLGLAGSLAVAASLIDIDPTPIAQTTRTGSARAPISELGPPFGGSGIPASLAEQAQYSIARQEYAASRNDRGLQAPNRAHNLRTYFEPWGVRVEDRTADGSPELVRMVTTSIGRSGRLESLAAGEIRVQGARVENRRTGGITEWYENGEAGLEHGYVLDRRLEGEGALRIDVAFEGATVSVTDGRALVESASLRRLEYGKLAVEDATGRTVPAHMDKAGPATVSLVIDDDGAVYPIVVDPLLTSTADATLQSDQATAQLGYSVAGAGDVNGDGYADVIVGAKNYDGGQTSEGAAFVFHGGPSGIANGTPSSANATLQSDLQNGNLGESVAGAGDVNGDGYADVIVGAPGYNAGQAGEGVALVFHGGPAGITSGNPSTANATLQSDQGSASLGGSVAGAGDVNGDGYADVIVGSLLYDSGEMNEGAAFVFHGGPAGVASGNPGSANATLQSNQASALLGIGVAGGGDVNGDGFSDVIVGAYAYDSGQMDEGSAFVFHGSVSGIASGNPSTANATLQSDQASAFLGFSVEGAGDVNGDGYADVIVGAFLYDSGELDEGAAFVFHGGASGIASGNPGTANATLQSNQAGASLGSSVAGAGDVNGDGFADVIVGARSYTAGQSGEGAAFLFHGGSTGVTSGSPSTANATLQPDQASANMGQSAAGAGDVNGDGLADVIVGADLYDAGQDGEGAAFVYLGGAEGVRSGNPASAHSTLQADQASAQLGFTVAGAGDVNGDGYSDVIVGALGYDAGEMNEGAAFVYHGGPAGIANGNPASAQATLQSNQADADFGYIVAGAGDVNGDGFADVIVGSRFYDLGQTDEGAAFVFHGSSSGITSGNPSTANATIQMEQQFATDISVAGAGDVNGDGFADVIVGAYEHDIGESNEGAAYIFHGSASGITSGNPSSANTTLQSNQDSAFLGISVAGAGDVNGDGYADVIVGAFGYDAGQTNEGAVFVFHGGPAGIANGNPMTANATLQSDQDFAGLGNSVAAAGDVNGDGFADVIVASQAFTNGQVEEGAAFVFHGSASGIASGSVASANATLESNQVSAQLGRTVAGAGDVNGDGYADVVCGAWLYNAAFTDEGAAFVFHGGPSGVASGNPSTANTTLLSAQGSALLGVSVAGAGDVNGDGYADVIVGAPNYDSGQMNEGAAFVFLGNGDGVGRSVRSRQLRGNADTTNVEPWGSSRAGDFQVRMVATHPEGRGRVKLQIQACPAGQNWGGGGTVTVTSSTWTDVTATSAGVTLTQTISGLSGLTLYRWRARVLHAPFTFVSLAATPSHGPWRRLRGQAVESDIRTEGCTITCPSNITTGNSAGMCGATVNYAAPVTTGMCGTVTCVPASGSFFALGTTMVNCSTTSGPSCSFTVTVNDTQAPVANCPAPITVGNTPGQCSAVVSFSASASDNCPGASIACAPTSGSTFPIGTTLVTCTATDAASNTGTCSFNVTVNDTQAPALSCPANVQTIALTPAGRVVSYTVPTATDNCGATVMCAPVSGSTFAIGSTMVTCSATDAANNMTNCQFSVDVAPLGTDTAGIYVPATSSWFLRDSNTPGGADIVFGYGPPAFNWLPLEGDWDGNGTDTPGLYDPVNGNFFLKNTNAAGGADLVYGFGPAGLGWKPLVGDWNGDGVDTVGLYDPVNGNFFLRNAHAPGPADLVYGFGPAGLGWIPLVGDWDGNASDTVGLYDPVNGNFFLRNAHAAGGADLVYGFGPAGLGWKPLFGDWNGDGSDTIGLYDPVNGFFFLRNSHAPGPADLVFGYGPPNATPILGDWNGL